MSALDPIELQVLTGALRAACEEMGVALIQSAYSSNIKERHDASTGLFDADGQMIMQAEHIPVHLGSMPASVAAVLDERHAPGVSWILNDPFAGGTHLPDITVITPVFSGDHKTLLGFSASRAHHADVGGRVPGSMPADSRTLAEEGVVISPRVLDAAAIEELVLQMRQPQQRRADLRAQLAANRIGGLRLSALAERLGQTRLRSATDAVLDYAERRTRACIAALPDREVHAEDVLEGREHDLPLRLRAGVSGERLILDFSGSSPQHEGNLNCPLAVTRSACYFAVRVLTDPDIPPSAGAYRAVEVHAPLGSLLNARPGAAVAAGNVETSSRVADLVLGAFGRALGQGTMNNLTLGADASAPSRAPHGDEDAREDDSFSYYETLGGGQGACAEADGPNGVHVAMSNTLNTPVEALEREFPLRVVRYELRRGSGGRGRTRGGDGVVRELEALREMSFSLIGERRRHPPPGAEGGEPGARGLDRLDGEPLPGKTTGTLRAGQRLRIETPGGGGHGRPD
ncbi:MAG TPA: hydantoinase B/oxoprolinase family protein [Solirubrobacteraceae bacterium]|jgi:N-methylhydantoinase B|nr:hydantoinase B/oxoprolinase family protein [Solirubrobacteraceae bacterium]